MTVLGKTTTDQAGAFSFAAVDLQQEDAQTENTSSLEYRVTVDSKYRPTANVEFTISRTAPNFDITLASAKVTVN